MTYWELGFLAAFIVVVVVAVLLLGILYQARRILKLAKAASVIVEEIDANTRSVWALRQTNAVAAEILDGAGAIETNASAIVEAVSHEPPRSSAA